MELQQSRILFRSSIRPASLLTGRTHQILLHGCAPYVGLKVGLREQALRCDWSRNLLKLKVCLFVFLRVGSPVGSLGRMAE